MLRLRGIGGYGLGDAARRGRRFGVDEAARGGERDRFRQLASQGLATAQQIYERQGNEAGLATVARVRSQFQR